MDNVRYKVWSFIFIKDSNCKFLYLCFKPVYFQCINFMYVHTDIFRLDEKFDWILSPFFKIKYYFYLDPLNTFKDVGGDLVWKPDYSLIE